MLFTPLSIRGITFRNRIGVSPMCQYSYSDGFSNDWQFVHLGSRAVGGAGLVFTEAAAVTATGRISPQDLGIWKDEHIEPLARCTRFITTHGAVPGIQLAHAGRKASTAVPWRGRGIVPPESGGWDPIFAPSAIPFDDRSLVPHELTLVEIAGITKAFADAAKRAQAAGFHVIELHSAHGYLLHEFLSPLSNHRTDQYGGPLENRTRLVREVVTAIRAVWPTELPLFIRISATDWVEGGWDIAQSIELARQLKPLGVDLVDCSSGALVPYAKIPTTPGYQVPFAEQIRREASIPTAAVGLITEARAANEILENQQGDLILLARQLLRDPYWPLHAAKELGAEIKWPVQYERAAN
jgi:2,4-dienoyl-CoA reductase-like NADH-dependent reductase (Old Yellow Enzyme family)